MQFSYKILLLVLLIVSLASCKTLDLRQPEVTVVDAVFNPVSLTQGRLDTKLSISNPNVFKLPIKAISYRLMLNDKEFLTGSTQHDLSIAAGGQRSVGLPLDIQYNKLVSGMSRLLGSKTIRFQIQGEVDLGLLRVPYRKTGEFRLTAQ